MINNQQIHQLTIESLRDWFKKEKWVRITTSGNIAGPCGTSKNKKNPDRCLPRAKAQSLTKAQRAATARKKRKAGAKGKTVVKNTKKATVKKETKGAPKGHYFTKSGNLVKGRLTQDARERGARLSDPKDKQRSKVPPVTQYNELELPSSALTKINSDVKNAKTMAQSILQYIDAVDDKEQPAIFKNPKLRRAIELLKDLGDDEPTQEPTNETANPQDGKAAPFGSGFKKVNEMTIEDIKNLTVGLLHEIQGKEVLMEKDDRCTRIAKRKYDTWPSAYASGAVVRCRRGEIWKGQK